MSYLKNFYSQRVGDEAHPKLVFLHGLMGYAANWRKITSFFEKNYHILCYDQRGHGRSFQPESGYAPEDYANDLAAILDELQWDSVILVGHSMGGRNALNFAYRFPHRVQKLVVEDIGPDDNKESIDHISKLLNLVPTPFATKLEAKEFFLNDFIHKATSWDQAKMLGQYLYSNIETKDSGEADWRFSKPGILKSVTEGRARARWEEIEGLQCPTLLLRGENSKELPVNIYQKMLKSNPLITGVEIPGSGHWIHADKPREFCDALLPFFKAND